MPQKVFVFRQICKKNTFMPQKVFVFRQICKENILMPQKVFVFRQICKENTFTPAILQQEECLPTTTPYDQWKQSRR